MEQLFNARSLVIVGVSERPGNIGYNILSNLINWDYEGDIYCVNPKGGEALWHKLYPSVSDLPQPVDLGVIIIPAPAVPGIVEECGEKGIGWLAIPSGGFEEFGADGASSSGRLLEVARRYGIRFVGPNCLTVINSHTGMCLPFVPLPPDIPRGGVSIVAQSGGIGLDFLARLKDTNTGFAKFVSIGNKTDLDEVDFLEYLGCDPDTRVICMYLEDVARGRELCETAGRIKKPILIYKANVEPVAMESAQSHTAALANDDEVLEGAFRQAGIIRVHRLEQLASYAKVFSLPPLKGNRIALVSPTGGILVLAADQCARRGFEFPRLPPSLVEEIKNRLRAGIIKISNPTDLGDVHDADARVHIMDRLMGQDFIDGAILILVAVMSDGGDVTTGHIAGLRKNILPDLGALIKKHRKPLIFSLLTTTDVRRNARYMVEYPIFTDAEEAVDAAAVLRDFSVRMERLGDQA
ncbi:MAG: CoA-binding protein [Actinomycetota bacterium]|nr:CoA-binding protein [Actinomycetota bacterium]